MQAPNNINTDSQELINQCYSMAEKLLIKQREFYPFGAYINNDGEFTHSGSFDGDEYPLSNNVIAGLKKHFNKQLINEEIRAYAIAFDTKVKNEKYPEPIDAISIQITHKSTESIINYYFPYKMQEKQIEFFQGWEE